MRDHQVDRRSTDIRPPLDDAAVEDRLRAHQRINRVSALVAGIGAAIVLALYLGVVPTALRPFVRPVLVLGVILLFALEAWRQLGHGQQPGRFRWTRLTIGACVGAFAIGLALRHIWPSVDLTSPGKLGVAVALIAVALVCDLRESSARPS